MLGVTQVPTKRCSKCRLWKPYPMFNKHRGQKDGHQPQCRDCSNNETGKKGWRADPDNKIRQRYYDRVERDPHKKECHKLYRSALVSGRLVRGTHCRHCGCPGTELNPIEGHHHDYDKPYDVWWLCRICHARLHAPGRCKPRNLTPTIEELSSALSDPSDRVSPETDELEMTDGDTLPPQGQDTE